MTKVFQRCVWTVVPIALGLVLAFSSMVFAQVDTGTISGTAKDQSGAVMPGVTITLTNEDTNVSQTTVTNERGSYQFPALRSGTYSITGEVQGFKKFQQQKLPLSIQQRLVIDLAMQLGVLEDLILVTGEAPMLQTQDASVGLVMRSAEIETLPLVSRNYTFLAQLNPGVIQGAPDGRGLGAAGSFSANGQGTNNNNYMLDGVDNNSNLSDFLNSAHYVYRPAVESLQEFKVQTSGYSAEFGRAGGAILNATLKSGTERYSGGMYEYYRNAALDSPNFFDVQANLPKGVYKRNQFGALLGGPVSILSRGAVKTFFFADYEGTISQQAVTSILTTPTRRMHSSNFTDLSDLIRMQSGTQRDLLGRNHPLGQVFDPATTRAVTSGRVDPVTGLVATGNGFAREPFAGNIIPANRFNPDVVRLLKEMPLPLNDDVFAGNYVVQPISKESNHQFDVRIDNNFGAANRLFIRASYSRNPRTMPPITGEVINGEEWNRASQEIRTHSETAGWTWVMSPTLVSEWRFGYSSLDMTREAFQGDNHELMPRFGLPPVRDLLPGYGGMPLIQVTGLARIGVPNWLPTSEAQTTPQVSASVTKLRGNHSLRGGFTWQRPWTLFNQPQSVRGGYTYSGQYTDLAGSTNGNTGIAQILIEPTRSTVPGGFDFVGGPNQVQASNYPDPMPNLAWAIYGGFVEDTWRLASNLTLNVGVRYDYTRNGNAEGGHASQFLYGNGPAGRTPFTAAERNPRFVIARDQCNRPLSPSFKALTAADGIAIVCDDDNHLVGNTKNMISPRAGLTYQFHPRWVVRTGVGRFYQTSNTANILREVMGNYPFSYNVSLTPNNAVSTPIVYGDGTRATSDPGIGPIRADDPTVFTANGLGMEGIPSPRVYAYNWQFNVTVQHELSPSSSVSAGYVGSRGRDGGLNFSYNPPRIILPPSTNTLPFREFPSFSANGMQQQGSGTFSRYNSMQLTYNKRFGTAMSAMANYTLSKCESEGAGRHVWVTGPEWNRCTTDAPHVVNVTVRYELPFGQGQRFASNASGVLNGLIGGWSLSTVGNYASGPPQTINCNPATMTGGTCYALLTGEPLYPEDRGPDRWLNPAAFMNPPNATTIGQTDLAPLGGEPSQVRAPDFRKIDLSLQKGFNAGGSRSFTFRVDISNLFDRHNFAAPGTSTSASGQAPPAGVTNFTNLQNFGRLTALRLQQNDQRQFQFSLKYSF